MKTILASNNQAKILVDDEDYAILSKLSWTVSAHGYAFTGFTIGESKGKKSVQVLMHRLVMGLKSTNRLIVDHINGNKLDNRKENLRIVNASGNAQNANRKPSASGFMGVFKEGKGFKAYITANTKRKHIGTFATAIEAAKAYDREVIKLHGPDALTNKKIIKKAFDL